MVDNILMTVEINKKTQYLVNLWRGVACRDLCSGRETGEVLKLQPPPLKEINQHCTNEVIISMAPSNLKPHRTTPQKCANFPAFTLG